VPPYIFPSKNDYLLVIVPKIDDLFLLIVITPTLSAFQLIVYPVFFVNLSAIFFKLSLEYHPLDGVTQDGAPPSDATALITGSFLTVVPFTGVHVYILISSELMLC